MRLRYRRIATKVSVGKSLGRGSLSLMNGAGLRLLGWLALSLALAACSSSPVTVTRVDAREVHRRLTQSALSAGELSTFTRNVLLEADLEEVYFYKIERPEGFAYQRIYTGDRRLDEVILVRDSQLVLLPEGYHPVVAGPGSHVYYLNMLAGSAQSLAATDDPDYAWIKDTWTWKDPRVPLVR